MALDKITEDIASIEEFDPEVYAEIYWNETEPKTKSISVKIEEISDLVIDAYESKPKNLKPYEEMSPKERWKAMNADSQNDSYKIHLEKYFRGDQSILRQLKNDLELFLASELKDAMDEQKIRKVSGKIRISFGTALMLAGFAYSLNTCVSKEESGNIQKLPEEFLFYTTLPLGIFVGFLLVYGLYNTVKSGIIKKEIETKEYLNSIKTEIIQNMPEEYFIKALEGAKLKLPSFPEIKKV